MKKTLTEKKLAAIAGRLDPQARERAHSLVTEEGEAGVREFVSLYLMALAALLGEAGREAHKGVWEPETWLREDWKTLQEHGELLGEEFTATDWRMFFSVYSSGKF